MLLNAQYSIRVSTGAVICIGIGTMKDSTLYGTSLWDRNDNLFINYVESPNDIYSIWEIILSGADRDFVFSIFNELQSELSAIRAASEIIDSRGYKQAIMEGNMSLIWNKPEFKNFKNQINMPTAWAINKICFEKDDKIYRLFP